MTTPHRISAFAPLSAPRELQLAQELLEIQSEEELDRFLPLILPALKLAAPLLKGVAGSLLGGLGGGGNSRPRRPRNQQEYFLGNIVKGLFGELQPENEQEEQFLGRIIKGLMGEQSHEGEWEGESENHGETERFIGGLIGKLFGGRREMEAENYVQEQFIGGLIGKLFGGRREMETADAELEQEVQTGRPSRLRLRLAQRFVRIAYEASQRAAQRMASLDHRPSPDESRRIVLGAIIDAARRFTPRLASAAFGGHNVPLRGRPGPQPIPPEQEAAAWQGEGTLLDRMLSMP